jgi:hypothetical protein
MNPKSEEAAEHQSGALQRKQQLASLPAAGRLGTGLQRPNSDLPRTRFTKVARIEAPHESDGHFVSHGSKIFATQPGRRRKPRRPDIRHAHAGPPGMPVAFLPQELLFCSLCLVRSGKLFVFVPRRPRRVPWRPAAARQQVPVQWSS